MPHHGARVQLLSEEWMTPKPWNPIPMEHIKNYFGEELGLYFCWTDHFRKYLIVPAFIGLIAFVIS